MLTLNVAGVAQEAPGGTVTGDTIVIGQTAAQSGPQAPICASRWGLEAFIASVNDKGGVHGKKLRLISYDDSYQPSQTTALDKKLVYEDKVFAIVAPIGSPTTAAVYKMLNDAGVPLISMGSGSPIFYASGLEVRVPVVADLHDRRQNDGRFREEAVPRTVDGGHLSG